jgi:glyoxylase-like metal-dependent hydrolase (beta-lactamase superfamily II)/ferredoxin
MAKRQRSLEENAPGDFFVDDSCIDCATCRWVAPATFDKAPGYSIVRRQPETDAEARRALMALVACPTASIGFSGPHDAKAARDAFPDPIVDDVFHCGFHAESSFGAASWLITRPGGNVLVDSPRWSTPLARRIEELGGVKTMFLTHRDDVADHARWAAHFGAERVLHEDDVTTGTREVERQLRGREPIALADDLLVLPVPGHTRGSACLLYDSRALFTGDHLAWRPNDAGGELYAFRGACWYSWPELVESTRRLAAQLAPHDVEHVLPGHGRRVRLTAAAFRRELQRCLDRM